MIYKQQDTTIIDWTREDLIEVTLVNNTKEGYDNIKEVLQRMGVCNEFKKLTQTAHLLYMNNKFYITHFKELFALDSRLATLTQHDANRRSTIARLLEEWGLVKIVGGKVDPNYQRVEVFIISKMDRPNYIISDKYTLEQSPLCFSTVEKPKLVGVR